MQEPPWGEVAVQHNVPTSLNPSSVILPVNGESLEWL